MIEAIRQIEALPEFYPEVEGVTGDALDAAWQRIDHYIAYRFAEREVTWYLDASAGEWLPPLAPIGTILAQTGDGDPYVPEAGPMGGYVLQEGQTVVTATVGTDDVPSAVTEAVRRLAAYLATADSIPAGMTRFTSGSFSASMRREDMAQARAMVNSGAADLLRAYRRV